MKNLELQILKSEMSRLLITLLFKRLRLLIQRALIFRLRSSLIGIGRSILSPSIQIQMNLRSLRTTGSWLKEESTMQEYLFMTRIETKSKSLQTSRSNSTLTTKYLKSSNNEKTKLDSVQRKLSAKKLSLQNYQEQRQFKQRRNTVLYHRLQL